MVMAYTEIFLGIGSTQPAQYRNSPPTLYKSHDAVPQRGLQTRSAAPSNDIAEEEINSIVPKKTCFYAEKHL